MGLTQTLSEHPLLLDPWELLRAHWANRDSEVAEALEGLDLLTANLWYRDNVEKWEACCIFLWNSAHYHALKHGDLETSCKLTRAIMKDWPDWILTEPFESFRESWLWSLRRYDEVHPSYQIREVAGQMDEWLGLGRPEFACA